MADDRLRELERRFRETGAVEDEAAWLRERLRVGELRREALEPLVAVGYPALRGLVGDPPRGTLLLRLETLVGSARELQVRVAVAAARVALELPAGPVDPDEALARADAVRGAEAWVRCPCAEHEARCDALADDALPEGLEEPGSMACAEAAWAAAGEERDPRYPPHFLEAVREAVELAGEPVVERAVGRALAAWLLGYGDPLARPGGGSPPEHRDVS